MASSVKSDKTAVPIVRWYRDTIGMNTLDRFWRGYIEFVDFCVRLFWQSISSVNAELLFAREESCMSSATDVNTRGEEQTGIEQWPMVDTHLFPHNIPPYTAYRAPQCHLTLWCVYIISAGCLHKPADCKNTESLHITSACDSSLTRQ